MTPLQHIEIAERMLTAEDEKTPNSGWGIRWHARLAELRISLTRQDTQLKAQEMLDELKPLVIKFLTPPPPREEFMLNPPVRRRRTRS